MGLKCWCSCQIQQSYSSCVVNALFFSFSTFDYCVTSSWLITDLECPAM